MSDGSFIQSVEKAAAILDIFTKNESLLSLNDIHLKTKFSKTSLLRFCNTLCNIGYLEKVYVGKVPYYRLGIKLFTLGSRVIHSIDLPERAKKYLISISEALNDNSYLFIERNNKALCVDKIKGKFYIQTNTTYIGDTYPLHIGGGPLAILAHMDLNKQSEIINMLNLSKDKKNSLCNRLELTKRNGYSLSKNEVFPKTAAVGVPIFNHEGLVIAALSVGGIETRFSDDRLPEVVKVLKEAALKLSREIGWSSESNNH